MFFTKLFKRRPKKKLAWLNKPVLRGTERTWPGTHTLAKRSKQMTGPSLVELSHELRTPLHLMLGRTRILRDKFDLSAEVNDELRIIEENGHQLLSVIAHVLGILRGEKQPPQFQKFADVSYDDDISSIDFSQIQLPKTLHTRLMEAAKFGELTRLEGLIDEIQCLGEKETSLADRLFKLTQRIDLTAIQECLTEVSYA